MALKTSGVFMGITWWMMSMAMVAVALRFYARKKGACGFALDDWMMVIGCATLLVSQILVTVIHANGLGKTNDLTLDQKIEIFKLQWIYATFVILSSLFSRFSLVILLSRIFGVKKWFRWYLIVIAALASCLVIVLLVELWTSCSPVSGLWNPVVRETGKCLDSTIFGRLGDVFQGLLTVTDVTFVLFPVTFVWRLNMAIKKKVGLILVFCLGLFTAAASLMKMILIETPSKQSAQISSTITAIIWGITEAAMVIIMGCIPTLGPLVKMKSSNIRSVSSDSSPATKSAGSSKAMKVSMDTGSLDPLHLDDQRCEHNEPHSSLNLPDDVASVRGESRDASEYEEKGKHFVVRIHDQLEGRY